jgi:pimeloyl-ACP methyl ester carboxylesterase
VSPHRCLAALLAGAVALSPVAPLHAQATVAPQPSHGLIFAVDGSGLLRELGPDLDQAVRSAGLPCRVETFHWSHGRGRVFRDYFNQAHHATRGRELAGRIQAERQRHPDQPIFIVCHSSGAAVVLEAAQSLPAGSVDRIILLAPALAAGRDLGPALRAARGGVDAFYNRGDLLSHAQTLVGTPDGGVLSAGGVGFVEPSEGGNNLRQHAWDFGMMAAGNYGGHFGWTRSGFLTSYVVPMLREQTTPVPAETAEPPRIVMGEGTLAIP